jgi:hypothetical protein
MTFLWQSRERLAFAGAAILFGALGCSSSGLTSGNTGGAAGSAGTSGGGTSGAAGTAGTSGLDGGSGAAGAPGTGDGGVGAPCKNLLDCAGTAVCDPQTAKCSQTAACGNSKPCPNGQTCEFLSDGNKAVPTCYVACSPSSAPSTCPTGFLCEPADPIVIDGGTSSSGICVALGSAALGASCTPTDISTGCADPHDTCSDDGDNSPTVCRSECDRTVADPGCPSGEACDIRDVCLPVSKIESASVGAPCSNDQGDERACGGVSNGNVVGYCGGAGAQPHCDQICDQQDTKGPACPNGTTCSQPLDQTIQQFGTCQ